MLLQLSVILFTWGSAPLHAGIHPAPLGRHPPGRHPPSRHSPGKHPLLGRHSPSRNTPFGYYGIRSTIGRILLECILVRILFSLQADIMEFLSNMAVVFVHFLTVTTCLSCLCTDQRNPMENGLVWLAACIDK